MNRLAKHTIERRKKERRESIADEIIRLQNAVNLLTWERDELLMARERLTEENRELHTLVEAYRAGPSRHEADCPATGSGGGSASIHAGIRVDAGIDEC